MKKFEFTLDRMLRYKDRILDEEKNTLARLRMEKETVDQKIRALEQAFQWISQELADAEAEGTTIQELRSFNYRLDSIRAQLDALRHEQAMAGQKVERQTKVVVAASQEVSKLDKLQDKQREVYKKDVQKAEELRVEELVSSDTIRKNAV